MTREEQAALKAQRLREKLDTDKLAFSEAQKVYRAEQRNSRSKRRYRLGTLADEAGLAIWDEPTLAAVFAVLARLRQTPDPAAVLDGLLMDYAPWTETAPAAGSSLLASSGESDSSAVSRNGEGNFLS